MAHALPSAFPYSVFQDQSAEHLPPARRTIFPRSAFLVYGWSISLVFSGFLWFFAIKKIAPLFGSA
jgi:hypothetical protein